MGRAMLFYVILMTTVFASVLSTVQRNIGGVPDVLIKNELSKELENVSDFVLRNTVKGANSQAVLDTVFKNIAATGGEMVYVEDFSKPWMTRPVIGNCEVQSLTYSYSVSGHHYKVNTVIKGSVQGVEMIKEAEMAFDYPMVTLGKMAPNVVYLEFEQVLLLPWLRKLFGFKNNFPDSSSNNYAGEFFGFTFWSPTAIDNTAIDDEVESWTGLIASAI